MAKLCLTVFVSLAVLAPAFAYPQYWAEEYNRGNCFAVPTAPNDCHKAPVVDRATTITVLQNGRPVSRACAGQTYTIRLGFPNARLAYLTLSSGTRMATLNNLNRKCTNTFTFTPSLNFRPSTSFTANAVAPSAGTWSMTVASATGSCAPFQITRASIPVARC